MTNQQIEKLDEIRKDVFGDSPEASDDVVYRYSLEEQEIPELVEESLERNFNMSDTVRDCP